MATDRTQIGYKFENGDIPSQGDFQEVFNSFIHKDEDKADFQMVEDGRDNQHYVTPALLYTGLKNIGIITGNSYMPRKEHFDSFVGDTIALQYAPVNYSVKVFKNGQLLLEKEGQGNDGDYIINYEMAKITFSGNIDNRNIEVDYWYKNLAPNTNPGGGSSEPIDFTSFLHTSGNETKNGILTFNNTTPTSTSGIVLTNSGADTGAKVLDVTVTGAGSGIAVQNTATGTGIKVSNTGAGTGLQVNSSSTATGDPLQIAKDNIVKAKIDAEGIVTAKKFVSEGGTAEKFVKGDGSLDPKTYAEDNNVIHTTGNESKDGALNLTHNTSVDDVLTITKNNSANCLKLVQNSSSSATTSTFDTNTENVNRKAISVQKIQVEKAFITHDGNVSGTSFTTLNEKADITDGFLTLAASTAATAMAGHAKLYAKTDGTTDLYVMGSDGVEKKIGASGGTTITGTANKLTKFNSTGNNVTDSNITDNGSLVTVSKPTTIDSGTSNNSGLTLAKLTATPDSYEIFASGSWTMYCVIDGKDGYFYAADHYNGKIIKFDKITKVVSDVTTNSISNIRNIVLGPDGYIYTTQDSSSYHSVLKVNKSTGAITTFCNTSSIGNTVLYNLVYNNGYFYVTNSNGAGIIKIDSTTATASVIGTYSSNYPYGITFFNQKIYVAEYHGLGRIFEIDPVTGAFSVWLTTNLPFTSIMVGADGYFYCSSLTNYITKINPVTKEISEYCTTPLLGGNNLGIFQSTEGDFYTANSSKITKLIPTPDKVLTTTSTGLVVRTKYLEDIPYVKADENGNPINQVPTSLDSPNFTGIPTAPTAAIGTNTNQLATTAFVMANSGGATSGNYTPVISSASGIIGTNVLRSVYTKIGNLITVTCMMSATSDSTGDFITPTTKAFYISLPFTAQGDSTSVIVIGSNNDTGNNSFTSVIGSGDGNNGTKAVVNYKATKSSVNYLQFTITYNIS
ncbi:hypothetical protein [Flavobacterium chungangensis]|uniref:Uncharacterized protein n=1 Tax=Flavobacterium chungangensis TaxID=2708132 RepID=A0ABV8ZE26_9FLAO